MRVDRERLGYFQSRPITMAILEFFLTDPDGAALEQFVDFEWRAKKFVGIDKRAPIGGIRFGKMIARRRLIKDNLSLLSRLPFYFASSRTRVGDFQPIAIT